MPTKAQLESALRNADKAGDAQAAKALANALKAGQYDEPSQPAPTMKDPLAAMYEQEKPAQRRSGRGQYAERVRAKEQREREALEKYNLIESGELSASQLPPEEVELIRRARINALPELRGLGADVDYFSALAGMTAFDPHELGKIINKSDPRIGIVTTPEGEAIAVNNETGAAVNLNKAGPSLTDAYQFAGGVAAFAPASRAVSLPAMAGAGMATQAVIEAGQELAGGEFNPWDVALAGAAPVVLAKGAQAAKMAVSKLIPRPTTPIAQQADDAAKMALEPMEMIASNPRKAIQQVDVVPNQPMQLEPIDQVKPKTSWLSRFETPTKAKVREMIEAGQADDTTAKYIVDGAGKLKADPLFRQAEFQQFDQGTLAAVVGAPRGTKANVGKMLDIVEKGMNNKRYASEFRPSDVIGDSLKIRVEAVKALNDEARKELRAEASKLRGQNVNITDAVSQLLDDLDEIGVRVGRDFSAGYRDSQIGNNASSRGAISDLLRELRKKIKSTDTTGIMGRRGAGQFDSSKADAYKIHSMKKFIDEELADYFQTEIGTTKKSGGTADAIIKKFRHNIDTALDNTFDGYNAANTKAAGSIEALNNFKKAFGNDAKDITIDNLDKYLGTKSRGLLANIQSRPRMLNSIKELEQFAAKYNNTFDDDVLTQAMVVDELERRFGSFAPQSFQGNIEKAIDTTQTLGSKGIKGAAIDKASEAIKNRRINEEKALKAFRDLLNR